MKKLVVALGVISLLILLYILGPAPDKPDFDLLWPVVPTEPNEIQKSLAHEESLLKLRANNQAQVIWADSARKTNICFLYLHGFSASQMEGFPAHKRVAQKYRANLFLARLSGHGYSENSLHDFTAESGWNSAREALAMAAQLGDTVVIMSTSTGCTFALMLAAAFPEKVYGLINLSPNIRVNSAAAFLLNDPWGKQIAHMVIGEERRIEPDTAAYSLYWDTLYTLSALVELQSLLETAMVPQTFAKIEQPVLNLYYFKNEEEKDQVVNVEKIKWMHRHLATPEDEKVLKALATPGNHVLASPIKSDDVEVVIEEIIAFCDQVLALR